MTATPGTTVPEEHRFVNIIQCTLEPGWAGELAPDELEFLQVELSTDKKLAFQWGFRPAASRRPEWAIRQVAMWGDPDHRGTNVVLARTRMADSCDREPRFKPKDLSYGLPAVLETGGGVQLSF